MCQVQLARSQNNIGVLKRMTGKPGDALDAHNAAIKIEERLVREYPEVTLYQNDLASSYVNAGVLFSETNRPHEMLEAYSAALKICLRLGRAIIRASPNTRLTWLRSKTTSESYSATRNGPTKHSKHTTLLSRSCERLIRANPALASLQSELARTHNGIGVLQSSTGRASGTQ